MLYFENNEFTAGIAPDVKISPTDLHKYAQEAVFIGKGNTVGGFLQAVLNNKVFENYFEAVLEQNGLFDHYRKELELANCGGFFVPDFIQKAVALFVTSHNYDPTEGFEITKDSFKFSYWTCLGMAEDNEVLGTEFYSLRNWAKTPFVADLLDKNALYSLHQLIEGLIDGMTYEES